MADTYEKDLAQKSSLTTSDFIRVVGSDNVSYKQNMNSVMETMGLKYADLGSFSTQSALETALNTKLNAMPTNSTASFRIAVSATFGAFQSGVSYIGELRKGGSATYASISLHGLGINAEIVGNKASSTWTFQKEPTRAEVDALANKHNTITVSGKTFSFNTSGQTNASWLVIGCSGTVAPFCFLVSTASGNVVINELVDPYGLTWTGALSGTTLTITCSASLTSNVKVIGL